jgi:hypothetical protein
MELIPTDLILRRREAPSRRMAAGTISLVAVLRDARRIPGLPGMRTLVTESGKPDLVSALLRTRLPW